MDFLRRLHPGHADNAAAARLDRAPRRDSSAEAPRAVAASPFALSTAHGAHVARADAAGTTALPSAGTGPQMPSAPPDAAATSVAAPLRLNVAPPQLPDLPVAKRATAPPAHRQAQQIAPARTAVAASGPSRSDHPRAAPSAAATTLAKPTAANRSAPEPRAPLRAQALQQAAQAQKADAAPVVHVTIDRIDVRLPAPASGPAPTRKVRPASTVAPLGDYLRTNNGAAR